MKLIAKNFKELVANSPSNIFTSDVKRYLISSYEEPIENLYEKSFSEAIGGEVYLVENLNDLKEIPTVVLSEKGDRYLSLYETSSEYDICEPLSDGFVHLMLVVHNGGGNTYLIPNSIKDLSENLRNSILKTHTDYERDDFDVSY